MAALTKEMKVKVTQLRWKGIGIDQAVDMTLSIRPVDAIARLKQGGLTHPHKEVRSLDARHLDTGTRDPDLFGFRQEQPEMTEPLDQVATQDIERIVVAGLQDALERFGELGGGEVTGGHEGVSPTQLEAMAQRSKMVP